MHFDHKYLCYVSTVIMNILLFFFSSKRIDCRRRNLTSIDIRFWRLKWIPTLKGLKGIRAKMLIHHIYVMGLTLTTLKYFCINHEDQRFFFQFEIIINVLVSSFRFIWIPCYGSTMDYPYFNSFLAIFIRRNQQSEIWRRQIPTVKVYYQLNFWERPRKQSQHRIKTHHHYNYKPGHINKDKYIKLAKLCIAQQII